MNIFALEISANKCSCSLSQLRPCLPDYQYRNRLALEINNKKEAEFLCFIDQKYYNPEPNRKTKTRIQNQESHYTGVALRPRITLIRSRGDLENKGASVSITDPRQ